MSDNKKHATPIKIGDVLPYVVNDGQVTIFAIHETTSEGYQIVDVLHKSVVYNPDTGKVYGSPQGPPL